MRIVPAIILAVAIILAPVIWIFLPRVIGYQETFDGPAIDSGARIEIEMLSQQVEDLRNRVEAMTNELARVGSGTGLPSVGGQSGSDEDVFRQNGPNDIIDAYAQVVLIADRANVNDGLEVAGPRFLSETFGPPRENLSDQCESMTNERLADKLVLEEVGPIRVRMLQPAVDSLRRVFENVRVTDPDLYDRINTAGSLCVRQIRGTNNRASTHAFGLAVDLNIDGVLDTLGDGKTQLGLTILADFFKDEGWVWGAAWGREDSMHFEVSRKQLMEWIEQGLL